jgi:hypothetical protein
MVAGMSDLVEFLRARLDEDEKAAQLAKRAIDQDWHLVPARMVYSPRVVLADIDAKRRIINLHSKGYEDNPGSIAPQGWCTVCDGEPLPCPTLRLLALPYADHPDYRDEWRP